MKEKISVLMTVYNGGGYLSRAIESVLAQTFKDFEFVIIDDGSTDDSVAVVRSFNDPRIKLYINHKNCGQTCSLNIGLKKVVGKYVARIDADDIALPRWLEGHNNFLLANLNVQIITTDAVIINEKGLVQKLLCAPRTQDIMILKSLVASPINHGGCLMNRQVVLDVGGYNERYRIAADYDLWSRLLRQGANFGHNASLGMAIRFHNQSLSISENIESALPEAASIMRDNVFHWGGYDLVEDEMKLLWRACYVSHHLEEEDIMRAITLFQNIYRNINLTGSQEYQRQQQYIMLIKRIFGQIESGQWQAVVISLSKTICYGHNTLLINIMFLMAKINGRLTVFWLKLYQLQARIKALLSIRRFGLN